MAGGIGPGRILSAANGGTRSRKMENVCEGDKYRGPQIVL